ncbi:MAG: replication-associated recombination protein A, partial [bacterium]|nr:replication-associated recombination protein A [bacterium]
MVQIPLAETLRPKSFQEFIGQEHLVGRDGIILKLLKSDSFPSFIFWGPPGSGKTTLARLIAKSLKSEFYEFSAVNTSSKEIAEVVPHDKGQQRLSTPLVFIDEIHRFNKAQQDRLLPSVERGDILLIGATTENPSFEIIAPLLSRCRVLVLNQLSENELGIITARAARYLKVRLDKKAKAFLLESADGDARVALNVLEIAANISSTHDMTVKTLEQALQRRQLTFDLKGEEYYNVTSAFIKSMRASNVDAALYYLARMVEAGQDPLYIARRMVIFASEDIGVAQPTALVVANEIFKACEVIGYPECAINLAHGVVYLCLAKKDRSAYDAYRMAVDDVRKHGNL